MVRQKSDWLSFLCESLSCSQNFREALDQQLAKQAYTQAGIDVRDGFFLVPENCVVHYDQNNVAYLDADLIAPDNFGYPIQISWRCEAHLDQQITPDNPLLPSQDYQFQAWWQVLPIEELRKYSQPSPALISETFSFVVEWQWLAWPDICLELQTRQPLSQEQIQVVEVALEQVRAEWNRQPEERGIIHNWSGLHHLDNQRYEMSIDFGSTDHAALSHWLEALGNMNHVLSLTRVIVRSVSLL